MCADEFSCIDGRVSSVPTARKDSRLKGLHGSMSYNQFHRMASELIESQGTIYQDGLGHNGRPGLVDRYPKDAWNA